MIARPLDLSSHLRRQPRSFDWVFYVNFGVIVLFFVLFGSRFVLSPALAVDGENLRLSTVPGDTASFVSARFAVSVKANGQIFVDPNGLVSYEGLRDWLSERAKRSPGANVMIYPDKVVSYDEVARISVAAIEVGLFPYIAAATAGPGVGQ
jgi:biopolymer transport protein ExbD